MSTSVSRQSGPNFYQTLRYVKSNHVVGPGCWHHDNTIAVDAADAPVREKRWASAGFEAAREA